MSLSMKKNTIVITILIFILNFSVDCFAQNWNTTSNNYTTGKVGIGTQQLGISGTSINNLVVGNADNSEGIVINAKEDKDAILAFGKNYSLEARFIYSNLYSKLEFYRPETGYLFSLTGNGNLGLGVRSPTTKLEINGGFLFHKNSGGFLNFGMDQRSDFIQNLDGAYIYSGSGPSGKMPAGTLVIQSRSNQNRNILFVTGSSPEERMRITGTGNVGIGTLNPDEKLTVNGSIHTQEVRVDVDGFSVPDFVFKEGFDLMALQKLKEYIEQNHHLPNIPSASELENKGMNLKQMNLLLLQKIEELTLYVLSLQEQVDHLKK
ncbi:tail fiber protein [Zunongwangia profunda]|uniref:tail fiber protein n=1 Tax=Zunongwangia profunda TaxID=398743 RepID=UPI001D19772B|nr:tail fiber protein [Zunongwangia profunda]MCC4230973.1 tail fiber protein [Zunongwangia profunda]